jgi:hypothetical protein
VQTSGYTALNVGGLTRAFGSFSSSQEYAIFLSIGLVCWVALLSRRGTFGIPVSLAAIALLGWALVLESGRSSVLLTVVALFVMLAARSNLRLGGAALVGIVGIALLIFVAGQFGATPTYSGQGTSPLTSHLLTGLANPTAKGSSLVGHTHELVHGIGSAFSHPLGSGTGSVTIAAGHFGAAQSLGTGSQTLAAGHGSEADLSNAGVALGLLGLFLFVLILAFGLSGTYRLASDRRDAVGLAALGLVVVTLLQWLNGDLYSVSWLVWLTLGWVDINYAWKRRTRTESMRDSEYRSFMKV